MYKVGLVSLGCAKNLIDSEMILGMLSQSNFKIVTKPEDSDVIIVNTCGFILDSKKESIDTILEMAKYHKKLVVTGCLVERYYNDLKNILPEASLLIPIRDYGKMNELLENLLSTKIEKISPFNRVLSTPPYTAYLRISEGCDNHCSYCAIPLIRGDFVSRPLCDIVAEATKLDAKGIKEIVIISQDVTHYGSDMNNKYTLVDVLKALLDCSFYSIRLLYLYPDEISDELISLIKNNPRISPYFDIPLQHASSKILKSMNRRGDQKFLYSLFSKIKQEIPHAIFRSTFIVGFPGETKKDFDELLSFIDEIKFDHVGAFAYSKEEDTVAFSLPHQVSSATKAKRLGTLMEKQKKISYEQNKTHIGEVMEGIVISFDPKNKQYALRSYWNAPDDIDGNIIFTSKNPVAVGSIVKVKITNAFVYDLFAERIED